MEKKSPLERYKELKQDILSRIKEIDKDTPWKETEPAWWLEMMELYKTIRDSLPPLKGKSE